MEKPTLIYSYDPLCGWCFGFHPVMEKLSKRFGDQLNIEVLPGGLAIDENAESIGEGYNYIRSALVQVEERTGVKFGDSFKRMAEQGTYYYDSEPPCRVLNTIIQLAPEYSLEFAGVLQKSLFVDGKNLNEWSTFQDLIQEYPISPRKAEALYTSRELKKSTREKFQWARKNNASSFPTLLLNIGDELAVLSRGYRPYEILESHIHHLIKNYEKIKP